MPWKRADLPIFFVSINFTQFSDSPFKRKKPLEVCVIFKDSGINESYDGNITLLFETFFDYGLHFGNILCHLMFQFSCRKSFWKSFRWSRTEPELPMRLLTKHK